MPKSVELVNGQTFMLTFFLKKKKKTNTCMKHALCKILSKSFALELFTLFNKLEGRHYYPLYLEMHVGPGLGLGCNV